MNDKLKPVRCGCGGKGILLEKKVIGAECYHVVCTKCRTSSHIFNTEAEAIEAWNRAMGGNDINVPTKWIPISERLPEEDEEVLVTVRFDGYRDVKPCVYVEVANRIGDKWTSFTDEFKGARRNHHVIAWMPLPEPYRAEGKC